MSRRSAVARVVALLGWSLLLFSTQAAWAHKPSDSYLSIAIANGGLNGRWDIALRDLEFAIGLDADGNGEITWGELRARHADIASYALTRLAIRADDAACTLQPGAQQVDEHSDGAYTVLALAISCPRVPEKLTLHYTLFADIDPQHRGLLNLSVDGATRTAVLGPQAATQTFELAQVSRWRQFVDFAREGVWHIWIGFDHILFLLSLLLPAVLVWRAPRWQPADALRDSFWEVFRIVTAFTVAHSITLSLATLGMVALPSRLVESAIAAVPLGTGYHAEVLGEYAEREASARRLVTLGAIAMAAIFVLLYTDFGSLRLAILVFVTLPFALIGGVAAAWLSGGILSLGSLVGFITVLGIAARNGIMLISHYRHLQQHEGMSFGRDLVLRGAEERLAPILMTATITALALLPIALGGDRPGQEIEHPMAVVILGGLVSSTLLNLAVVPALFLRFGGLPPGAPAES